MHPQPFSKQVEKWLDSKEPKTLGRMADVFGKSSFATIFILCMALPATPLPTGGITHVLEALVLIVAFQTILGLKNIWLPSRLKERVLPDVVVGKLLPKFIYYLKKLEKHSRIRGEKILNNTWTERFAGLMVLVFTLGAMFAVPFSNLDTLVSVGVVVLSLGLVLNDISFFIVGILIGSAGLVLEITVGTIVAREMEKLWSHFGLEARLITAVILLLALLLLIIRHRRKK